MSPPKKASGSGGQKGDSRFDQFGTDPKFRNVPKKTKKVEIDQRFKGMFKDKSFVNKVSVDKRGRPAKRSTKEDYERYYSLKKDKKKKKEDEEEDDSSSSAEEADSEEEEEEKTFPAKEKRQKAKSRLQSMKVDYARGEGVLLSDSSSEEEDEDSSDGESDAIEESDEDEDAFDRWGELDRDAEQTEEAKRRMAVCNMDWDRVKSEDLFLALSSFCPKGGRVDKVNVYVSDFGKGRLEEEDRLGPEELRRKDEDEVRGDQSSDSENDSEEKINTKAMERARKYQVNKLRYYYAVVEFDSPETANKVYEECDGAEYELSATRFDLRFVPDDMEFEDDPTSTCDAMPDANKYRPKSFFTTALQQGKVELTWDENDPERAAVLKRAFENDNDEDVKAYLNTESTDAESDGDDEPARFRVPKIGGDGEEEEEDLDVVMSEEEESTEAAIAKYKALLGDLGKKEKKKKDEEGNMEITFKVADPTKGEKEKQKAAVDDMTPWEQYVHKKKERREAKRLDRQQKRKREEEGSDDSEDEQDEIGNMFSDDDVPSDLDVDDDFFKRDDDDEAPPLKKKKKVVKKKKREESEEEPENKDLSLLVMDSDDDDKGHFDYKDIVANETATGKKKKKGKKKRMGKKDAAPEKEDDFQLDLKDNRFGAMFKHADFNVDPSHPSFKKTKSMQKIIEEKQKRILAGDKDEEREEKPEQALDSLVKAVQAKTKASQKNKNKKRKGMKSK